MLRASHEAASWVARVPDVINRPPPDMTGRKRVGARSHQVLDLSAVRDRPVQRCLERFVPGVHVCSCFDEVLGGIVVPVIARNV